MPASSASRIESAAKRGGTKTIAVWRPVCLHRGLPRCRTGDAVDVLAALPGVTTGDHVGAVAAVVAGVERALAAGEAGDDEPRLRVDQDAHAVSRSRSLASATTSAAALLLVASCLLARNHVRRFGQAQDCTALARAEAKVVPAAKVADDGLRFDRRSQTLDGRPTE